MKQRIPKELLGVYKEFDSCRRCRSEQNPLLHILGGGKFRKPCFLFLFINPTHLNLSGHREYQGKRRYPFIGVRYFYRLLAKVGFVDEEIVEDIYKNGWQVKDEDRIEESLLAHEVYLTNLVKCTKSHPQNPSFKIIREDFSLLEKEISLVSPKYIVAFGKLPFQVLTNRDIRLRDCLLDVKSGSYSPVKSIPIFGKKYKIFPCYFLIGRGSPAKAVEILRYIKDYYKFR